MEHTPVAPLAHSKALPKIPKTGAWVAPWGLNRQPSRDVFESVTLTLDSPNFSRGLVSGALQGKDLHSELESHTKTQHAL